MRVKLHRGAARALRVAVARVDIVGGFPEKISLLEGGVQGLEAQRGVQQPCTTTSAYRRIGDVKCVYRGAARP